MVTVMYNDTLVYKVVIWVFWGYIYEKRSKLLVSFKVHRYDFSCEHDLLSDRSIHSVYVDSSCVNESIHSVYVDSSCVNESIHLVYVHSPCVNESIHSVYVDSWCINEINNTSFIVGLNQHIAQNFYWRMIKTLL